VDLSIDNPNLWYELGVRHALRARGVVQIKCKRDYMPFDVYTDRTFSYHIKNAEDASKYTRQMQQITLGLNDTFLIPLFDFQGTATGIDIRKVVKTGILPVIDTAIAHKEPGIGMIGAGIVTPPMEAFKSALRGYAEKYRL
jgi:hypothetical protein